MDIVAEAQRVADEVLFPAAQATDASDIIPAGLLDAVARAGLFGIAAPREAGGLEADFRTVCAVHEALASGCLTTAFLWMQHTGLVRSLAADPGSDLARELLAPLAAGQIRAGLGLGGALPAPTLRARRDGNRWVVDGVSPFVSGWGLIDVVHVAARTPGDQVAWLVVDAAEGPSVRAERIQLAALNATATVRLIVRELPVPASRLRAQHPVNAGTPPQTLRMHASLALGVTARCCALLGPTPLDDELAWLRAELDQLGPGTAAARAAAGELAVRGAAALMTTEGSRSLLAADQAQRLMREAMFTLVYALRPESRTALLNKLGAVRSP